MLKRAKHGEIGTASRGWSMVKTTTLAAKNKCSAQQIRQQV